MIEGSFESKNNDLETVKKFQQSIIDYIESLETEKDLFEAGAKMGFGYEFEGDENLDIIKELKENITNDIKRTLTTPDKLAKALSNLNPEEEDGQ